MMIEVRDLKKSFGPLPVLQGVTFSVEKGEAISIIGVSGGGKSVLLKHVIGLMTPDSGEISIDGRNIAGLDERELLPVRRMFGMLFVLNREHKSSPEEISKRVQEVLDLVGLSGIEKQKPAELSGGMRKRVGLARAVIYRPQILLYDEPTTGLDPIAADTIDQLIIRVVEKLKVTSIAVTHDMRSARRIGHRILMLHDGRIYADQTPDELFKSKDPVIYRFVNGISDLTEKEKDVI
jgi:phospholipid/cholesterol/gamma-HCH transport system ATP-binding protein